MAKVIIYTTPTCVYCKLAMEFFVAHGVAYEEKDVAKDEEAREAMISQSGQMGVPVISVDGNILVGFDKSKLAELLGVQN